MYPPARRLWSGARQSARAGHRRKPAVGRAALAAVAVLGALWSLAPPAGARQDPRARRAALLLEAAELTDRLETIQAAVVTAQLRQARADGRLAVVRARMKARAVSAYIRGTGAVATALTAPRAYLQVAATKERRLLAGYRAASASAAEEQQRAEAARGDVRRAAADLAKVQAELDAVIAADDARRAEEQRRADAARQAALQRAASNRARALGRARAGLPAGSPSPGGYAPSPLDPAALLPRHRAATQRQLELMRRIPFGPLTPGAPLPARLQRTGVEVAGQASWYGPGFNGRPTASGAIYDQEGWTVASRDLPLGSFLVVTRGDRRVLLLVNDRGPYVEGRVLDLSAAAARALGVSGVAPVAAEVVVAP